MRCVLSAERASHCSAAFFVRCRSSFSLSKVSSLFSFEAEKRTKKTHKIVLEAFDQNTKISKAPSFSSSLGEDAGHARSSSLVCLVWYVRTSVVFLLLFLCSNAFTKRRRRRGVSSRARSARARRRVDEKGVERG